VQSPPLTCPPLTMSADAKPLSPRAELAPEKSPSTSPG
jgi:hypothetical protein